MTRSEPGRPRRAPERRWLACATLGAGLGALAAQLACKPALLRVEIPLEPGASSGIVAVESGSQLKVLAIDGSAWSQAPLIQSFPGFDGNPPIDITAMYYASSLEDLVIAPGELSPSVPGRPLPGFLEGYLTVVDGSGASAPSKLSGLDDPRISMAVRDFTFPTPCRALSMQSFSLPTTGAIAGAVPLTSTSALVLTHTASGGAAFYAVGADGPHPLSVSLPDLAPNGVLRGADGQIYLIGTSISDGRTHLRAGTPATGFQPVPDALAELTGPVDVSHTDAESPTSIYALDVNIRVERFDGNSWTILGDAQQFCDRGSLLAWSGPSEVILQSADTDSFIRVDARGAALEYTTPFHPSIPRGININFITALGWASGFGVVGGTHVDGLYGRHASDGSWRELVAPMEVLTNDILAATGYRSSLIYGGNSGTFNQYFAGFGACDPLIVEGGVQLTAFAALDGGGLVVAAQGMRASASDQALPLSVIVLEQAH